MKKFISFVSALAVLAMTFLLAVPAAASDVPSGQIWEGESDLRSAVTYFDGTKPYIQDRTDTASMDSHLFWKAAKAGDTLEMKLNVETFGVKTVYVRLYKAADFGKFDIYWDDVKIGENIDSYGAKVYEEFNLGSREITTGEHVLKFVSVGKNESATNFFTCIDYFELVGTDGVRRTLMPGERDENYDKLTVMLDGTLRYEAEGMTFKSSNDASITKLPTQIYGNGDGFLSYVKHVFINSKTATVGTVIELEFELAESGKYATAINTLTASNYAIYDIKVDDAVVVEGHDAYSATIANKEASGNDIMLEAGKHTMSLVITGRNEANTTGYAFSIDYLDLKKIGEYESPDTGDVTAAYIIAAVSALCAAAFVSGVIVKRGKIYN